MVNTALLLVPQADLRQLFERIEFQQLLGFKRLRGQPRIHDFPYNIGNAAFLPPGDLRQRFVLLLFQQDLCAVHVRFAHQSPPRSIYTSACVTVKYIYEEQNCDSAQDPGQEDEWAGEFARYLADRTSLNEGSVEPTIKELRDAILFFNRAGRAVKIEGLGTYTPGIDLEGTFDIQYRLDTDLKGGLNARNTFSGTIRYRENIGKSADDLIAMWNQAPLDDPVT